MCHFNFHHFGLPSFFSVFFIFINAYRDMPVQSLPFTCSGNTLFQLFTTHQIGPNYVQLCNSYKSIVWFIIPPATQILNISICASGPQSPHVLSPVSGPQLHLANPSFNTAGPASTSHYNKFQSFLSSWIWSDSSLDIFESP